MHTTALTPDDPQRLGPYWLAARLGSGGQGVVYEAYDAAGGRVAVKALRAVRSGSSKAERARLAKELRAARQVAAFCTARVLDADLEAEVPYIVSEFVPGPSLRQALAASGPMPVEDLLRLAAGTATALAAIHLAGVVHRDFKPDNILLGPDGPRVIDFGIARTENMTRTTTGVVLGTPGYMSPEAVTGGRAGAPADIFAWGAVMLCAATGEDPFRGETYLESAHSVMTRTPETGNLPEPLPALVTQALARAPDSRPTALQLLDTLLATAHAGPAPPAPVTSAPLAAAAAAGSAVPARSAPAEPAPTAGPSDEEARAASAAAAAAAEPPNTPAVPARSAPAEPAPTAGPSDEEARAASAEPGAPANTPAAVAPAPGTAAPPTTPTPAVGVRSAGAERAGTAEPTDAAAAASPAPTAPHSPPATPNPPAPHDNPSSPLLAAGTLAARPHHDPTATAPMPTLGTRAESAYQDLGPAPRAAVRELMLRLIAPGAPADGSADLVRTATEDELLTGRAPLERLAVLQAIRAFADAALLDHTDGTLRLLPPALPAAWPRLHRWVAQDREALRTHRRLGEAARAWADGGRRDDDLPHGSSLAAFLEFRAAAATTTPQLRPDTQEKDCLDAASALQLRRGRQRRRLRAGIAVLTALLLLAGSLAWLQKRDNDAQDRDVRASETAKLADSLRTTDPQAALLLSIAALRTSENPDSRAAVASSAAQRERRLRRVPGGQAVGDSDDLISLSSDGRHLTYLLKHEIVSWDADTGTLTRPFGRNTTPTLLDGSDDQVTPVVSEDGGTIAAADAAGRVSAWNLEHGTRIDLPHPIRLGADRSARVTAVSADTRTLITTTDDESGNLHYTVWDTARRKPVKYFKDAGDAEQPLRISPDGRRLAHCVNEKSPQFWDLRTGHRTSAESVVTECAGMLFSPDGRTLAAADEDGDTIATFDTRTGAERTSTQSPGGDPPMMSFSADGRYLAALGRQDLILARLHGQGSVEVSYRLGVATAPLGIGYDRSGRTVRVAALTGPLVEVDVGTAGASRIRRGNSLLDAGLSEDGSKRLLREEPGGNAQAVDDRTRLILRDSAPARRAAGSAAGSASLGAAPGPVSRALPGSSLPIWPLADGNLLAPITSVSALNRSGRLVAYNGALGTRETVRIWDTARRRLLGKTITIPSGRRSGSLVEHLALTPDGGTLLATMGRWKLRTDADGESASSDSTDLWSWDLPHRAGSRPQIIKNVSGALTVGPDGRWAATTNGDLVDLANGTVRRGLLATDSIGSLRFSPDGKQLAVGLSTAGVVLWDTATWKVDRVLPRSDQSTTALGPDLAGAPTSALVYSPDGRTLVGLLPGGLQLWDVETRQTIGRPLPLVGYPEEAAALAFTADGKAVKVVGDYVLGQQVTVDTEELAAGVCTALRRQFRTQAALRAFERRTWQRYLPDAGRRRTC